MRYLTSITPDPVFFPTRLPPSPRAPKTFHDEILPKSWTLAQGLLLSVIGEPFLLSPSAHEDAMEAVRRRVKVSKAVSECMANALDMLSSGNGRIDLHSIYTFTAIQMCQGLGQARVALPIHVVSPEYTRFFEKVVLRNSWPLLKRLICGIGEVPCASLMNWKQINRGAHLQLNADVCWDLYQWADEAAELLRVKGVPCTPVRLFTLLVGRFSTRHYRLFQAAALQPSCLCP